MPSDLEGGAPPSVGSYALPLLLAMACCAGYILYRRRYTWPDRLAHRPQTGRRSTALRLANDDDEANAHVYSTGPAPWEPFFDRDGVDQDTPNSSRGIPDKAKRLMAWLVGDLAFQRRRKGAGQWKRVIPRKIRRRMKKEWKTAAVHKG